MTSKNCANGPKLVLKDLCESLLCKMSGYPIQTCTSPSQQESKSLELKTWSCVTQYMYL